MKRLTSKAWWVQYGWKVLKALDHLGNALLDGIPGETISARAATARRDRRVWGCVLCWLLDRIDKDHCTTALSTGAVDAQRVSADLKTP